MSATRTAAPTDGGRVGRWREPVLVSACLLGDAVRHDGGHKRSEHPVLARWRAEGRIVPVCPEVAGADAALALARRRGARLAVLKQASPSCGSTLIHDGTAAPRELREADLPDVLRIRAAVTENRLVSRVIGADEVLHHCRVLGRGWVAEEGGRVAGFAIGNAQDASIWALFVDPAHAGRGHGRRLHDAMVAWMFAQGLPRLVLGTDPGTRAHAFYRSAGWRETGLDDHGEMRMVLHRPEEMPA